MCIIKINNNNGSRPTMQSLNRPDTTSDGRPGRTSRPDIPGMSSGVYTMTSVGCRGTMSSGRVRDVRGMTLGRPIPWRADHRIPLYTVKKFFPHMPVRPLLKSGPQQNRPIFHMWFSEAGFPLRTSTYSTGGNG
jgi:hypothetical protein